MREITMYQQSEKSFAEVFKMFEISQAAKGITEVTLKNYRYHLRNISKYLDINEPFESITKNFISHLANFENTLI